MKILCFIDSLGSGGAQRQLVELGVGFKERGHDVTFLVYHDEPFFLPRLHENKIEYNIIESKNYFDRIIKVRKFIRKNNFNVVLSFLEGANFMATLASFPTRNWKLIVGERSANPNIKKSLKLRAYRYFHLFTDFVVSNSTENIKVVKNVIPILKNNKCKVIYNALDLDYWKGTSNYEYRSNGQLNILVASSHQYLKNSKGLLNAILALPPELKNKVQVNWYGNEREDSSLVSLKAEIKKHGMEEAFILHSASADIKNLMKNTDIVGLFSFYEGMPNVICEAMSIGKPVMTSSISDIPIILNYNNNLLFNPNNTNEIKDTLIYVLSLTKSELKDIGATNRIIATNYFDKNKVVSFYESLME